MTSDLRTDRLIPAQTFFHPGLWIVALLLLVFTATPRAEVVSSEKHDFTLETLVTGLEYPWALEFLPDGRMLVTEKVGRLRIIENGRLLPEPVGGLPPIAVEGQGGLLDVALDPDFENNGWIYLSFSAAGKGGTGTEVIRGRLVNMRLEAVQTLFRLTPKSRSGRHFGSRLLFGTDGHLYISLGDRGDRPRAQDLADHAGSLIRIHADGSVPDDNPFVKQSGALPEIYTYGNRNIQGLDRHPESGDIWSVEHGPQGGDELNRMQPGVNYGWPVITYGKNYVIGTDIGEGTAKPGMAQPVHYWVPSIAISSLQFYDGAVFPAWRGNAFVSSLKFGQLARLELQGERVVHEERLINDALGRLREVRQGPDGLLYLLTDAADGRLVRMNPVPRD